MLLLLSRLALLVDILGHRARRDHLVVDLVAGSVRVISFVYSDNAARVALLCDRVSFRSVALSIRWLLVSSSWHASMLQRSDHLRHDTLRSRWLNACLSTVHALLRVGVAHTVWVTLAALRSFTFNGVHLASLTDIIGGVGYLSFCINLRRRALHYERVIVNVDVWGCVDIQNCPLTRMVTMLSGGQSISCHNIGHVISAAVKRPICI